MIDSQSDDPAADRMRDFLASLQQPNLEQCDLCHEWKPLLRTSRSPDAVNYTGTQFLCPRCLG